VTHESGESHVFANAIGMIVMALASVYVTGWLVVRYAWGGKAFLVAQQTVFAWILAASMLVVAVVSAGWASINAWALLTRKPWARTSAFAYWCAASVFCCCLPGGIYGVWSLSRHDVRERLRS
jgi:hypothetical protein